MATFTSCKRKIATLCVAIVCLLQDTPKPDVTTTALLGNTFHEQHWELELMFPGWQNWETFVSQAKFASVKQNCFWPDSKTSFCVYEARFASATMFPQQGFLVKPGSKQWHEIFIVEVLTTTRACTMNLSFFAFTWKPFVSSKRKCTSPILRNVTNME